LKCCFVSKEQRKVSCKFLKKNIEKKEKVNINERNKVEFNM